MACTTKLSHFSDIFTFCYQSKPLSIRILDGNRIHLLQHLQLIFPIKLVVIHISVNPPNYAQHQYTIASLTLPDGIYNHTVTYDQVSTVFISQKLTTLNTILIHCEDGYTRVLPNTGH